MCNICNKCNVNETMEIRRKFISNPILPSKVSIDWPSRVDAETCIQVVTKSCTQSTCNATGCDYVTRCNFVHQGTNLNQVVSFEAPIQYLSFDILFVSLSYKMKVTEGVTVFCNTRCNTLTVQDNKLAIAPSSSASKVTLWREFMCHHHLWEKSYSQNCDFFTFFLVFPFSSRVF